MYILRDWSNWVNHELHLVQQTMPQHSNVLMFYDTLSPTLIDREIVGYSFWELRPLEFGWAVTDDIVS